MIVQCPDCSTKMRVSPPASTPEGKHVRVSCRCGTKLRFRMPGKPKVSIGEEKMRSVFEDYYRATK